MVKKLTKDAKSDKKKVAVKKSTVKDLPVEPTKADAVKGGHTSRSTSGCWCLR